MSSRRYVDPADGWDWWGSMAWPPYLREFDPAAWPAVSVPDSWRLFVAARRAAAPHGWRLARVERMSQGPDADAGLAVATPWPQFGHSHR